MVKLYCMLYGFFTSGFTADGRLTVVGPAGVAGNTRGKMTVGAPAGFVKDGSLMRKGVEPGEGPRGTMSMKMPYPPRKTVLFPHGRKAKPTRGAILPFPRTSVLGSPTSLASITPT